MDLPGHLTYNANVADNPKEIKLSFGDQLGPLKDGVNTSLRSRSYLGLKHLKSARVLASQAQRGKVGYESQLLRDALVGGAVFTAVAFVEAVINEIWRDAQDSHLSMSLPNLDWVREVNIDQLAKLPTLDRYQLTLRLCGIPVMAPGANPFQHAAAAVRLRNELIHYQPAWSSADKPLAIDKILRGKFTPDSDSVGGQTPKSGGGMFPRACFTRECADWAVGSCANFVDAFLDRMAEPLKSWVHITNLRKEIRGEEYSDRARGDPTTNG